MSLCACIHYTIVTHSMILAPQFLYIRMTTPDDTNFIIVTILNAQIEIKNIHTSYILNGF